MILKKIPRLDLENYRTIFFLLGLALSLLIVILLISIKSYPKPEPPENDEVLTYQLKDDVIPITYREPPQNVTAPQASPEQINIIDDAVEVDDDYDFAETETDENEAVTSKVYQTFDGPAQIEVIEVEEEEDLPMSFAVVESPAIFPGCEGLSGLAQRECFEQKTMNFVLSHFRYSEAARQMRISGRIFVQFVVEKDGKVAVAQIVRGLDPMVDEEALRVVKSLPQMEPARQRGQPVRMSFILPIKLVLDK